MNKSSDNLDFFQQISIAFQEEATTTVFKKGQFLTAAGAIENKLYLVEEGAVKIYYLSELGEKIIRLGYNGSIMNSLASFLTQVPSDLYLEAIRTTKVKVLSRDSVLKIKDQSQGYSEFLESVLVQQLEREIDLLLDSPVQRLERVLLRSPLLFQYVPLKYIAAYLRMSPETLSRIRKS
ncbi:MAG: Crp/Fnr family transcriptional regulator [Saprospiraceae bacterium]